MRGRVMLVSAVALWVSVAVFAAPERERPGGDEKGRPGERAGEGEKTPTTGRGPGPSSRPWGGFGRGGMHRGGYRPKPLTKDEEAELLKHLKKHQPDMLKRLEDLRTRDKDGYGRMLSRLWGWYQYLMKLPGDIRIEVLKQDRARHEAYHLLNQIRDADSSEEKARLTKELREVVAVQFKAEQIVRTYRLTKLAKDIERILAEIKARTAKQTQEIVDSRVESMLKSSGRPPSRRDRGGERGPGPNGPKPPPGKGRRPADGGPKPKD